jgi:hypothetical protein
MKAFYFIVFLLLLFIIVMTYNKIKEPFISKITSTYRPYIRTIKRHFNLKKKIF